MEIWYLEWKYLENRFTSLPFIYKREQSKNICHFHQRFEFLN